MEKNQEPKKIIFEGSKSHGVAQILNYLALPENSLAESYLISYILGEKSEQIKVRVIIDVHNVIGKLNLNGNEKTCCPSNQSRIQELPVDQSQNQETTHHPNEIIKNYIEERFSKLDFQNIYFEIKNNKADEQKGKLTNYYICLDRISSEDSKIINEIYGPFNNSDNEEISTSMFLDQILNSNNLVDEVEELFEFYSVERELPELNLEKGQPNIQVAYLEEGYLKYGIIDIAVKKLDDSEINSVSPDLKSIEVEENFDPEAQLSLVLFGGATGDAGKFSITNETFVLDVLGRKWKKLEPTGQAPSQRAAHAATSVDTFQMVIYGGATGGGGLAPDDLFLLDLRMGEDNTQWMQVPVVGSTPGRRYGHSIIFCKPYLLVYGGNTGSETINDTWCLNVEKSPFSWVKLVTGQPEIPAVRVYHSASLCTTGSASGMMVVFGGRTADQSALNDTWGFRRHRNGKWDWVKAPYKQTSEKPTARYQHSSIFVGTLFMVIGGRTNQISDNLPLEIYDTESSDWYKFAALKRFRHASWCLENFLYLHGGFDQDAPNVPTEDVIRLNLFKVFEKNTNLLGVVKSYAEQDTLQLQSKQTQPEGNENFPGSNAQSKASTSTGSGSGGGGGGSNLRPSTQTPVQSKSSKIKQSAQTPNTIRMAHQAIVAVSYGIDEDGGRLIRKVSIDKLQEESKKLGIGFQNNIMVNQYIEDLSTVFINQLLIPNDFKAETKFSIKKELIIRLCDEVIKVFDRQPTLQRVKSPVKIFGNIHGQLGDLMKIFEHFGSPCNIIAKGDIDSFDYIFLGDLVDHGKFSVEVCCLFFALKLKYSDQIHIIRGHHEDRKINRIYGFAEECALKFNEDPDDPNSVYRKINSAFEYLPLAVVVDEQILCVHGGIGTSLNQLEEIENIERPFEIVHEPTTQQQKIVLDLLWSDPVQKETDLSNEPNEDRDLFGKQYIQRYGFTRMKSFLAKNNLRLIIRSHENVLDGFEKLGNEVITIFSTMDYNETRNAGCVLIIKKNSEIVPKVIYPSMNMSSIDRWYPFTLPDYWEAARKGDKGLQVNNVWFDSEETKLKRKANSPLRLNRMKKN